MSTSSRATKKQQELLAFVREFIDQHDYGPSYREIMTGLGYKSVSTVASHVEGLIGKGYLRRGDNTVRSLEIIGMGENSTKNTTSEDATLTQITSLLETTNDEADKHALQRTLELLSDARQKESEAS